METVPCNLCHSEQTDPLMTVEEIKYHMPGKFTIVRCKNCGLAYLSPRPTQNEIGAFYPDTYAEHTATSEPNPFTLAEAKRVVAYNPHPGKVLDIGCASGYFLAAMSRLGWDVFGIEPSQTAADKAANIEGAHIKIGSLQIKDYADGTFDVVTLWSVLEHLHNPVETLQIVRHILKPNGYLHICVPNFGSLERQIFKDRWFGIEVPRHLYHFDPKSIRRILKHCGFRIIQLQQASGHDVFKFSLRLARGLDWNVAPTTEGNSRSVLSQPAGVMVHTRRLVNRMAVNSFTRMADRIGQGSQMLVVAQPDL